MSSLKTLYHGSARIIKKPEFGKGNIRNDYGSGFYCTEDLELAKEWACSDKRGGFVNAYTIDSSPLTILNLSAPEYGVLNWLAILVNNRVFDVTSQIAEDGMRYLTEFFLPDLSGFDTIAGYRADDSYFAFAQDFLNNTITLRHLARAMRLGKLGEQFVLKSSKAFDYIRFSESIPVDGEIYLALRQKRNNEAREQYLKRERRSARQAGDLYLSSIIETEVQPGDERLQEIISA